VYFLFLAVMAIMLFFDDPMAFAGEADIKLPDLTAVSFMGGALNGDSHPESRSRRLRRRYRFRMDQYAQTKQLPSHQAMLDVSATIWETCKNLCSGSRVNFSPVCGY